MKTKPHWTAERISPWISNYLRLSLPASEGCRNKMHHIFFCPEKRKLFWAEPLIHQKNLWMEKPLGSHETFVHTCRVSTLHSNVFRLDLVGTLLMRQHYHINFAKLIRWGTETLCSASSVRNNCFGKFVQQRTMQGMWMVSDIATTRPLCLFDLESHFTEKCQYLFMNSPTTVFSQLIWIQPLRYQFLFW